MKKHLTILIAIFSFFRLFGQDKILYLSQPVYVDIIHQYIYSIDLIDSSVQTEKSSFLSKNFKISRVNQDSLLFFVYFDTINNLRVCGSYYVGLEVFSNPKKPIFDGKKATTFGPSFYRMGRRHGTWSYFNISNGELLFTEEHKVN